MTVLLVIFMLLAFVGIDYLVRESGQHLRLKRERSEREAILASSVRLEFADEAKSLKRVEVPNPKARILAVDDESVVLDSFRRILVLEGFSIDTVTSGPEALNLVQRNDYDFVFTDLKMPGMDGVEVVKAVKHLRPDVDMVVITGYGSIETAVETLQHGATEYVQKPFTVDELSAFVNKILVKRQARLEALSQPTVHIVSPSQAEETPGNEFCVPGGAFIAPGHTWARIEPDGHVKVGVDDFTGKAMGKVEHVTAPKQGQDVKAGDPLFTFQSGAQELTFRAPVSGKVVEANLSLVTEVGRIQHSPYKDGWVCRIQPSDLASDLAGLKIGKAVLGWYSDEIVKLHKAQIDAGKPVDQVEWSTLQTFLV